MTRTTHLQAASALYTALNDIIIQVEANMSIPAEVARLAEMKLKFDLTKAHEALATADHIRELRALRYPDSLNERENHDKEV